MVKHLIEQLDRLEEMLDDLGDTSGFERPPVHRELLEDLWNESGGEGSDDEVFAFVALAEEAGFSSEQIRDFLSNFFGDADDNTLNYWVGIEDDEEDEDY